MDFFANVIVFGLQQGQYNNWCINASQTIAGEKVTMVFNNGTQTNLALTSISLQPDSYNCFKLWQDEMKFAIAIFSIMAICYIYWATCLWSYAQKIRMIMQEQDPHFDLPQPSGRVFFNAKPSNASNATTDITAVTMTTPIAHDDRQQSLAQIVTGLFERLRSAKV
ncbi:hypothetical protein EC973_000358 [Apophysomyces ossiformis]|uniref:Uncharacterized protein n=1 Tax=Apophysomyces ossiformis TaxID=679940 RepID=A0A8H7BV58_9FUNG|nr:hypothetical protein EC973_000358 [Apophysomyces ossiformis]